MKKNPFDEAEQLATTAISKRFFADDVVQGELFLLMDGSYDFDNEGELRRAVLELIVIYNYYMKSGQSGPKPLGHFRFCEGCSEPFWVRPSFAQKGLRYCSHTCAAKDPEWRKAVGSYGGKRKLKAQNP